jgi:DNA-binding YbaB/EbfC family protein
MNIEKMMQQAQAMQGKVQAELKAMLLTGSAGGGLVRIEMTGEKEVVSVSIDRSAVDPGDVETLQDLVLAALRDAARQVDEAVRQKTSAMLGGMLGGR